MADPILTPFGGEGLTHEGLRNHATDGVKIRRIHWRRESWQDGNATLCQITLHTCHCYTVGGHGILWREDVAGWESSCSAVSQWRDRLHCGLDGQRRDEKRNLTKQLQMLKQHQQSRQTDQRHLANQCRQYLLKLTATKYTFHSKCAVNLYISTCIVFPGEHYSTVSSWNQCRQYLLKLTATKYRYSFHSKCAVNLYLSTCIVFQVSLTLLFPPDFLTFWDKWCRFLQPRCLSCHPVNNFKNWPQPWRRLTLSSTTTARRISTLRHQYQAAAN